jgi:hypothetical protein
VWNPFQEISEDEMMVLFTGSSKWKFECQPKPTPVGLKLLGLACPRTGYVVSFLLDKKGESTVEEKVMTLCLFVKGMWHHLYMDLYFVSVHLFKRLLQEGGYVTRTMGIGRDQPPVFQREKSKPPEMVK